MSHVISHLSYILSCKYISFIKKRSLLFNLVVTMVTDEELSLVFFRKTCLFFCGILFLAILLRILVQYFFFFFFYKFSFHAIFWQILVPCNILVDSYYLQSSCRFLFFATLLWILCFFQWSFRFLYLAHCLHHCSSSTSSSMSLLEEQTTLFLMTVSTGMEKQGKKE